MKIAIIKLELSYNAQLHGDEEKRLRQAIKDIYFPGTIKAKLDFLGHSHLSDNLIVDVEEIEVPD